MSRPFNTNRFNRDQEKFSRFSRERPRSFIQQTREILTQIKEDINSNTEFVANDIRINKNALFLGQSKFGPAALDISNLIDMRILIVGNSGSGKSYLTRRLIEDLLEKNIIVIICDGEGEWVTLRENFDLILLGKDKTQDDSFGYCDVEITEENFKDTLRKCIEKKTSIILRLNQWSDLEERQKLVIQLNNFLIHETSKLNYENIALIFEEAHTFAEKGSKSLINTKCRNSLRELASQARRRALSLIFITQRPPKLHTDITSQCNIRLIGKLKSEVDLDSVVKYLNLRPKEYYAINNTLEKQFIAEGDYFFRGTMKNEDTLIFKADKVSTPHLNLREIRSYKIPLPSNYILKTIKFINSQEGGENFDISPDVSQTLTNKNIKSKQVGLTLHDHLQFRHSFFSKIVRCFGVIDIKNLFVLLGEEYDEVKSLFEISQWISMNSDNFKLVDDEIYAENDDPSIEVGSSEEILAKWIDKLKNKDIEKIIEYLYNSENENNSLREISQKLKIDENTIKEIIEKYKATNLLKFQHNDVYLNTIFFNSRIDKNNDDDTDEFDMRSIFDDEEDI